MITSLKKGQTFQEKFGFHVERGGVHASRTIMFKELQLLLNALPPSASKDDYLHAIIEDNVLGKKTVSTRKISAQKLTELYGLSLNITLFRLLLFFWNADIRGRSLLAFLCAIARDSILRMTADPIVKAKQGEIISKKTIEEEIRNQSTQKYHKGTEESISRNAASSWTQSGHLTGRVTKIRSKPDVTPANATYALLLGYLEGARDVLLFDTFWVKLLDRPFDQIESFIQMASRQGWLDYRNVGSIVEIRFRDMLNERERELINEQS